MKMEINKGKIDSNLNIENQSFNHNIKLNTNDGCPCLYTIPCNPRCTCVNVLSSFGCKRCAKYGSLEQKKRYAKVLAKIIDENLKKD